MNKVCLIIYASTFLFIFAELTTAQVNQYQRANNFLQQQNYEEALPLFQSLYEENPRSFVLFDGYTESLMNLRKFDEAEEIARRQINAQRFVLQSSIRLAEILHLRGDREEAREVWREQAAENMGNIQAYYAIGSSMLNRQEFDEAIALYTSARELSSDNTLFLNELANTYMQAGRFEESVNQYYQLIIESPDQMSLVQQRFLRMRDENLYQIAAFELEDQLLELDTSHRAYSPLYQLLTWLLLETEEYRRAFVMARQYENQTAYTIYSLFSLASQMASARQFEYAEQALQYYIDRDDDATRFRAMEELSTIYIQWERYLKTNNLDSEQTYNRLNNSAYDLAAELLNTAENYDRAGRVYSVLIDLSLDHHKDAEKADYWYNRMKNHIQNPEDAFLYYAEGRIALFDKRFSSARQSLTRADRATDSSNLSERARYYLSLTDFYAGDYEFAEIQLRSLERRHTSFYANDAIKLRMWIKNGKRADTTGSVLRTISESLFNIHTGNYEDGLTTLEPILVNPQNPFADDLLVELGSTLPEKYSGLLLNVINRYLSGQPFSPLKERLMWDRANIIENLYLSENGAELSEFTFESISSSVPVSTTSDELIEMFEDLLMEFPDGFYAPYTREKLRQLETASI
ncbi:MAG: tetratricopeptide repeat protein [Balneolaceae bacterium]|nr:tetratricopeptide repeat protein [Balneolaceae bacterium]